MKRSGTFRSGIRRAALVLVPVVLLVAGFAFYLWCNRPTSSPSAVRPWAEAAFNDLVNPRPSPGSPLDPQYSTKVVRLEEKSPNPSDTSSSDRILEMDLFPATETFVNRFPVHTFDAADGMTSGDMSVRVKWLATQSLGGHPEPGSKEPILHSSDASGKPLGPDMTSSAKSEMLGRIDDTRKTTSLKILRMFLCGLEVSGVRNPSYYLHGAFDEKTRAQRLRFNPDVPINGDDAIGGHLTATYNTPLLLIFDLIHGEEEIFEILPEKGADIERAGFHLKILPATNRKFRRPDRTLAQTPLPVLYTNRYASTERKEPITSVVIDAVPNVVWESISIEAVCSDGRTLPARLQILNASPYSSSGRLEAEPVRIYTFDVTPSEIKHVRIRRKPLKDRFVIRVQSLPGLPQMPPNATELFDVSASTVVFENPYEMQTFIANAIQFQHRTTSLSSPSFPGFPMTMENATPRKALSHYHSLPGMRHTFIDQKEMTITFDNNMPPSWPQRAFESAKKVLGIP